MSTIKAVLVDDEISNIKGLEKKLGSLFPEIEIVEKFQIPEEAITYLQSNQPDILFLDIQMPRLSGFDVLSSLKAINFQVIFVTAYSEFAIEAFKKSAVDYILKPIDNEDLRVAVNKANQLIQQKNETENTSKLVNLLTQNGTKNNKIIIPTTKGISFIPAVEVLHLEGYEGYTKIHLANTETLISSYNLGKFEKNLSTKFFKCHKSHIINLEHVRHYENEGYLVLNNQNRVPISKTNKKAFLNLFN